MKRIPDLTVFDSEACMSKVDLGLLNWNRDLIGTDSLLELLCIQVSRNADNNKDRIFHMMIAASCGCTIRCGVLYSSNSEIDLPDASIGTCPPAIDTCQHARPRLALIPISLCT